MTSITPFLWFDDNAEEAITFYSNLFPDARVYDENRAADGSLFYATFDLAGQRFANQADAESWVGETWSELAEAGVDAVTLFEHDRQVYGPMSLSA